MDSQPKTVVVVDDDPAVRQCLDRLLYLAGYRVRLFASGEEFLAAVTTCDASCAVLDIGLGTMCGLDLAHEPAVVEAKLPLIFMSGTADETLRARASAARCIAFLPKPFKSLELIDAIYRATGELRPIR